VFYKVIRDLLKEIQNGKSRFRIRLLITAFTGMTRRGDKTKLLMIVGLWLYLPLVLGIILSLKISLLSYFRFLFILPAFYILITKGITSPRSPFGNRLRYNYLLFIFLSINIISTAAYLFMPRFHREDWRGLVKWEQENSPLPAVTVFPSLAQSAPYNYYQPAFPAVDQVDPNNLTPTVFLLRYVQEIFDPKDEKRAYLEAIGYKFIRQENFNGVVVWEYQLNKIYAYQ
jgi:hypothetical protein